MYEYCTSLINSQNGNKKLVLPYEMNFLILTNKTVTNSNPSLYYVSSALNGIYIIKPIITGDITYQKDGESANKIIISISEAGYLRTEIFHKGIKHNDLHPYIE